MNELNVDFGDRSYPIYFRHGAEQELVERVLGEARTGRAIVVSDENVSHLYAQSFVERLRQCGLNTALFAIRPGEAHKTLDTVRAIYEQAIQFGIDRETPIIAYGGGVVGDVAGFVAATLLRGLPLIQVPTTVLSQVDSSVGGKVGVNLAEGKNLVGAFHQPQWVFVDTQHLSTLDRREIRSGLVEALKHGALGDARILETLVHHGHELQDGHLQHVGSLIAQAITVKAAVVARDEKDRGERMVLNLGHTLGHALEMGTLSPALRHGEAVGLGLRFMQALSVNVLHLSRAAEERLSQALDAVGVPKHWGRYVNETVLDRISLDKKNQGDTVRVIGLRDIGDPVIMTMSLEEFKDRLVALAALDAKEEHREGK